MIARIAPTGVIDVTAVTLSHWERALSLSEPGFDPGELRREG